MADILYEIPQLAQQDCFDIVERHKSEFTYPLHKHKEFELNFVQNARGVRRIVGDSVEEIGDYDCPSPYMLPEEARKGIRGGRNAPLPAQHARELWMGRRNSLLSLFRRQSVPPPRLSDS